MYIYNPIRAAYSARLFLQVLNLTNIIVQLSIFSCLEKVTNAEFNPDIMDTSTNVLGFKSKCLFKYVCVVDANVYKLVLIA